MQIEEMLQFLRQSLVAYSCFIDNILEDSHEIFKNANKIDSSGNTVLAATYHNTTGKTPEDVLNMVEGYITALKEGK